MLFIEKYKKYSDWRKYQFSEFLKIEFDIKDYDEMDKLCLYIDALYPYAGELSQDYQNQMEFAYYFYLFKDKEAEEFEKIITIWKLQNS